MSMSQCWKICITQAKCLHKEKKADNFYSRCRIVAAATMSWRCWVLPNMVRAVTFPSHAFHFLYFVENPLQAMIALSLEIMDITRDWVFSFVVLCQAFTAADFRRCLFVGLSNISFVFSKSMHAQWGWDQEIDSVVAEYFTYLPS